MQYDVIINGVPVGEVRASSSTEARAIARGDESMNDENAPMDAIWAEPIEDDDEPRGTTPGCPGFRGNC